MRWHAALPEGDSVSREMTRQSDRGRSVKRDSGHGNLGDTRPRTSTFNQFVRRFGGRGDVPWKILDFRKTRQTFNMLLRRQQLRDQQESRPKETWRSAISSRSRNARSTIRLLILTES